MTEFTNGYFRMMDDIGKGYDDAKALRDAEKEKLMSADDWEGVKIWNEREKNFPFPFSDGYMKAFWAWIDSTRYKTEVFAVSELPWEKDAHDFVACLREAGISEFAITDRSTNLMPLLHAFAKEGCSMKGLCDVKYINDRWGEEEMRNGILMSL